MEKEDKIQFRKYVFWAVVVILLIVTFFMLKPYFIAIISAFILAYLTKPIHNRLSKKMWPPLSALICVIVVLIVIILPAGALIGGVIQQTHSSFNQNSVNNVLDSISNSTFIKDSGVNLDEAKSHLSNFIISLVSSALLAIPYFIISALIALFAMYYILLRWDTITFTLKELIPFKNKNKVANDIDSSTRGIVYGMLLIAIIEFIVAGAGFYLSGVKAYLLLAALIAFLAFIPGLGPIVVWVPTALVFLASGNYLTALGVIITGCLLTFFIEIVIANKITSKKAKLDPLITLIGVIGGVTLFGLFGVIIGPLVLHYTIKLITEGLHQTKI